MEKKLEVRFQISKFQLSAFDLNFLISAFCQTTPTIQVRSGGGSPGRLVRITLRRRRESRITLGCVTQRLQMGTKTCLSHRLYGQGRKRRKQRRASCETATPFSISSEDTGSTPAWNF